MIAALAVASGTVFAASSMPENKADRAVYDLTLTTKYLDRAKTNGVPFKAAKVTANDSKVFANTPEEAERQIEALYVPERSYAVVTVAATTPASARSEWNKKMAGKAIGVVTNVNLEAEFENFKATFAPGSIDSVKKTTEQVTIYEYDGSKAVISGYVPVVKQITYKVTDFHKPGKQVTKNLKGMVIKDKGTTRSYIWDDSIKDWVGPNPFAGSAADRNGLLKNVTIATASETEGAYFRPQAGVVDRDAKTVDGGFVWEKALTTDGPVNGWAVGTVKAANDGETYVISSLSGNFAGSTVATGAVPANGVYGTWKAQYNDKATQILLCQDEGDHPTKLPARKYGNVDFNENLVDIKDGRMIVSEGFTPESYEEILGTKKVERVQ